MSRYAKPKRTRDDRRKQLATLLVLREDISVLVPADLVRWTGLPEAECAKALQDERVRRARAVNLG